MITSLMLCSQAFGDDYPDAQWSLKDAWGDTVTFSQKEQQQPSLFYFWASWCPFCHKVTPAFQRIYNDYKNKNVTIYSVNVWETGDAMAYLFDKEFDFPVLVKGEEVADTYGIFSTPGFVVLDKDGKTQYRRKAGAKPEEVEAGIRSALDKLIN